MSLEHDDIFAKLPADWYDMTEDELKTEIDSHIMYTNEYFNLLKSSYFQNKYQNIFTIKRYSDVITLNIHGEIGILPMQIWIYIKYNIFNKTSLFNYKSDFENELYIDTHNTPSLESLLRYTDQKCLKLLRVFSFED